MKKTLIFILTAVLACAAFISIAPAAFAAGDTPETEPSLDPFKAELSYTYRILYGSGAYVGYDITFDGQFVAESLTDENGKTDFLQPLAELFALKGYQVVKNISANRLTAFIRFDTLTDLQIAQNVTGYDKSTSKPVEDYGFLYVRRYSKQNSPFTGIEGENSGYKDILDYFYSLNIERDDILLKYTYGTPYKIVTSDADTMVYSLQNNIYLHTYDMTMDMSDRKINLVTKSPNSLGWYTIAIGISVAVLAVPLTVAIIKRKKEKSLNAR